MNQWRRGIELQELKWGVQRLLSPISTFFKYRREAGLKQALRATLIYLGIKMYSPYSPIEYPVTGTRVMVAGENFPFWKGLEHGQWEFSCIKHISNLIKEGQILLDVGAWIGPYTLLFAKLVQDTGRVYAFEPDPKALKILRRNVGKNCLTNVNIQEFAISNFRGEAKLQAYGVYGDSMSNLVGRELRKTSREIVVKTTTIDEFCEENGICPDGIKIDVEGAEALVIEGCRNVIKKYSPWVLLEFHGHFISEEERRINWYRIVDSVKKVTFIDGNSNRYHYGSNVISMPDCPKCHVFIEY